MRARSRDGYAVVLGSNEVGSAVALALHRTDWKVVLVDRVDPGNPWRGMSFGNAWYMGSSELDGVAACFCTSVRSIPSVLRHRQLIAATTWSWQSVVRALPVGILVDAALELGMSRGVSADRQLGNRLEAPVGRQQALARRPPLSAPINAA